LNPGIMGLLKAPLEDIVRPQFLYIVMTPQSFAFVEVEGHDLAFPPGVTTCSFPSVFYMNRGVVGQNGKTEWRSFHVEVEVDGLGLARMNSPYSVVHEFTEPSMASLIHWMSNKSIQNLPKRHGKSNTSNGV
jgi:hypothetical protein